MQRWTPDRKAEIVEDILANNITLAEVCQQYDLSADEIERWLATYNTWRRARGSGSPGEQREP